MIGEIRSRIKNRCMVAVYVAAAVMMQAAPLMASANAGAEAIKNSLGNFTSIVSALISSVGAIFLLWGVFEFGTSLQSPNGSEQAQAFKRIAGGLLMTIAPAIVAGLCA